MDNINNGIQISGGTFNVDNLAVGERARAVKGVQAEKGKQAGATDDSKQKVESETSSGKVFISYSHKDVKWLERLQIHLKPLEQRGLVEVWDDTKISSGARWREILQTKIENATIAVILVSADLLASDFVTNYQLPKLLSYAESRGTVILPLIIGPCLFTGSGIDAFQPINAYSRPLNELSSSAQERTLAGLAETISQKLTQM